MLNTGLVSYDGMVKSLAKRKGKSEVRIIVGDNYLHRVTVVTTNEDGSKNIETVPLNKVATKAKE